MAVARRLSFTLLILLWFGCCAWPQTRTAPPSKLSSPSGAATEVTLGQSAVRLYGPWKFTVGDSPLDPATHQPLWAQPGFDDSHWETVDLTPKEGSTDPVAGVPGYVPGWTAKGHPGYWGYAWYRIRVHIDAQPGQRLALAGPENIDDAFQVFANGTMLGSFGDFDSKPPVVYYSQPWMTTFPQAASQSAQTLVLAVRVWMEPNTLVQAPTTGGFHDAPIFGDAAAVTSSYQSQWLADIRTYAISTVEVVVYLLLSLGAFSLIFFDRSDRVYLWMGIVFLIGVCNTSLFVVADWTTYLGIVACTTLLDTILIPASFAGWVMVWWVWFGLRKPAWLPRAATAMALLLAVSNLLGEDLWFTVVPHPVSAVFHVLSLAVRLCFVALMFWIVYRGIRLHGVDGWLALLPVVLACIGRFNKEFSVLGVPLTWFPFGMQLGLFDISYLLLAVVLTLLLLRRLVISLRKQRQMALDVKQAQEVQQVILPHARMKLPGLDIESEYRPALEVGGDFFQIIPDPTDGSLLIVAGDVVGKGLKAGMLVAMLVGAIRSTTELNPQPEFVLGALNRRLLGRGDAQATCLALRIEANGEATLVNAGHLPPYLNGVPLPMEGALPLGMAGDMEFSVMRFKLAEGDRLALVSDGIAEATDANGQLFGFERAAELLRTAGSAAEVASAAQTYGQEDDISVISVTRTAVMEPALA
jgi:hypothetical protein